MVRRSHWIEVFERLWRERSVVWLSGVRRVGKTFLCRSLPDVDYVGCELPIRRSRLEAPERFLRDFVDRSVVVDEIRRLWNPSELLKIAADCHPETSVIATGSSSLGASALKLAPRGARHGDVARRHSARTLGVTGPDLHRKRL